MGWVVEVTYLSPEAQIYILEDIGRQYVNHSTMFEVQRTGF